MIEAEGQQTKGKAEMLCSTGAGDGVSQGALFSRAKHNPVVLPTSPAASAASREETLPHSGDDGAFPFPIQQKRWPVKLMRKPREYYFLPKLVIF